MNASRAEELLALLGSEAVNGDMPSVVVDSRIVTLDEFVNVEEPGADPVVGEPDRILIPEGGDVMFYGDGGAGKTTLSIDLACHLAAGQDWLGITVPQPRHVLLIESEGPRPFFRSKLRRKRDAWRGRPLENRVEVFEEPWGQVTLAAEQWRVRLAQEAREREIDVLIAGPVSRLGMDAAGTLQEVRAFMELVQDVRRLSGRALTVVLVHHENKGGAVSGAWEGSGDTLLHVQSAGNGHTVMFVQKARWDSERHGKTMHLAWADGESFELEGDRDYLAEITALLRSDRNWRTVKEIANREGGIAAGETAVKATLDEHPERFESRTGEAAKAIGRNPSAIVWQVRSPFDAPDAPSAVSGGEAEDAAAAPSLKGAAADDRTPGASTEDALDELTQRAQDAPILADLSDAELLGAFPGSSIEEES
jgi:hypothetical protein